MLKSPETQVRPVAERIAHKIQTSTSAPDEPLDVSLHHPLLTATPNARRLFLDRALDRPTSPSLVDDHFRRLGYRQAARGRNHEVIDGAVAIALSEVWDELRVRAAENELSASALNSLSEALTGFVAHLEGQVRIGFATGSAERDQDQGVARARLLDHLLAGADDDEIETQAAIAQWPVPALDRKSTRLNSSH